MIKLAARLLMTGTDICISVINNEIDWKGTQL